MINPVYNSQEVIQQLSQHYMETTPSSVTMEEVFRPPFLQNMSDEIRELKLQRKGNPITHSFEVGDVTDTIYELFNTPDFISIVEDIIGKTVRISNPKIQKFGWKDYTILHDNELKEPGIDLIIDLTPIWAEYLGGLVIYTNGEGDTLKITPGFGNVSVIQRSEEYHYFIKYVNHYAQQIKRNLIFAEIIVEN